MRSKVMRYLVALFVALATMASVAVTPAWAGEDKGMCKADDSRGQIPGDFPIDACFDGKTLVMQNGTQFALMLSFTGNGLGKPQLDAQGEVDGASALLAELRPSDFTATPQIGKPDVHSGVVPPGYHLRVDVGNNQAAVHLGTADAGVQKTYVIAESLWRYLPVGESVKAVVNFVNELSQDGDQYTTCRARNNALGDIGRSLLMGRNVAFAVGRVVVDGTAGALIKAAISLIESSKWANAAAGDLLTIKNGTRDFAIQAYNPPPPPTTTQAPAPPPPPPNPGNGGNNGGGNNQVPPPAPAATPTAIVQNMHVEGASALVEDSTPVYLSTVMQPSCSRNGCKIAGTDMGSGTTITAICLDDGAPMTNSNLGDPSDDNNPYKLDSSLWMKASINMETGYISLVYIAPSTWHVVGHC